MSVARSYARALLEVLLEESPKADQAVLRNVEESLRAIADSMREAPALKQVFMSPGIHTSEKAKVLKGLVEHFEQSRSALPKRERVLRFLELVLEKGRLDHLDSIAEAFGKMRMESEGGELGVVESAEPLSDDDLKTLARSFAKQLGCPVELVSRVDPELLAGLRVTLRGTTYDGSLKAQLSNLKERVVFGTTMVH